MVKKILQYPHPVLADKAKPVPEITDEVRELARDMAETMYVNDGLGLAAPQIGECCRLVVMDLTGPKERTGLQVLVNPVIIEREGRVVAEEGCLSVDGYRTEVARAEKVKVKALDLAGNEIVIEADGLTAVCIQHEVDHLDGLLFIDRISRLKRALFDKKVSKWQKRQKDED